MLSRSLVSTTFASAVLFCCRLGALLDHRCQFGSLVIRLAAPFFNISSCDAISYSDALLVIKLLISRNLIPFFTITT